MISVIGTADLIDMNPEKEFFVGLDSDGCVFDSMELKHKECFCPAFINHFGFQGVCRYARETWEFVNLYSKMRGLNRFKALVEAIRLMNARPEVRGQLGEETDMRELEEWIACESSLGGSVLDCYIKGKGGRLSSDSVLFRSLRWSDDVTEAVRRIVHDLPPIAEARAALELMKGRVDCLVVSQTPSGDLVREWREHDIARFVRMIAGQEQGTKAEHLAMAAGKKYAAGNALMIGDAPGDYDAAKANGFLFFPIVPGRERESWREFCEVGLDRFLAGNYCGEYQDELIQNFDRSLPERPPWSH